MKKRIKNILVIVGIICLGIGGFFVTKEKKEDYEIISTIKSSHDNYESVTLSVIVNKRKYDAESLFYEISSTYWSLHENTDEIYIRLFNGRKAYEKGIVFADERFFKEY